MGFTQASIVFFFIKTLLYSRGEYLIIKQWNAYAQCKEIKKTVVAGE